MKTRRFLYALVLTLVLISLVIATVPQKASAATTSWVGGSSYGWWANHTAALNEVKALMQKQTSEYKMNRFELILSEYPLSGYFNASKTSPCDWHCGSCNERDGDSCINTFYDSETGNTVALNAWQCYGYARYCSYRFFGSTLQGLGKTVASSNLSSATNFKSFLSQYDDLTGAHFRVNGFHSLVYLARDDTYVYFIDANSGFNAATGCAKKCSNDSSHYSTCCKINLRRFTYSEFVNRYSSLVLYYPETGTSNIEVSHGYTGFSDTITDTNAIVYGTVSKASSDSTSKFGIYIRRTDSTYDNGWSYVHDASSSWIGQTSVRIWYDINDEVGLTLTHATSYTYKLYAVVNGKEYYSPEKTFTTTGSHSYGSWSTVKAATCTASGSQKRSCSCGAVETKTVAALGHNYSSSYTVDQAATCTESGSKSKHCSRCSARSEVTTIPATGHSYGAWVTESVVSCTEQGVQKRTCSTCQHVETETTAALGHDFAEEYTVDQAATCTESGSKSKHCSRCSARSEVTTIPATGHSYSDWQILTEATLQKEGSRTKACACGDSVTEAIPQLVGKVKQWNVALGDDLTVNFYLEVSDSIMSTAKVQLIQENSSQTAKISGLEKTADGLYKISVHMAATQMNDTITVMVKNGSDKAPSADYSIRQYCDTLLADEGQTQYHALIKEMLNYGAAAQAFFGYESDGAANEGITGAGQTAVPERAPEMSVSSKTGSVRFYGASLVYESKIAVRFYFSGDVSGCKFTVGEQTYTPVAKNGLYYIEVSDILPQNLDETIAVTVASGQDTLTVSYSPLTYLVRMNAKGSEPLQSLMRALYNYHLAAKALNAE